MEIRITHTQSSGETIPATGMMAAFGVPGRPKSNEETTVEVGDFSPRDANLPDLFSSAAAALIGVISRDLIEAEIIDDEEEEGN